MATDVGAKSIETCVDEKTYRPWVKYTTQEAAVHRHHRHAHRVR